MMIRTTRGDGDLHFLVLLVVVPLPAIVINIQNRLLTDKETTPGKVPKNILGEMEWNGNTRRTMMV